MRQFHSPLAKPFLCRQALPRTGAGPARGVGPHAFRSSAFRVGRGQLKLPQVACAGSGMLSSVLKLRGFHRFAVDFEGSQHHAFVHVAKMDLRKIPLLCTPLFHGTSLMNGGVVKPGVNIPSEVHPT